MDCKDWGKKREKFGKSADCKEKVKQKRSASKEENCKICIKRPRSFGKENYYENGVKRQEKSGKAELCEDGVKRQQEAGKTAAGGRMEKLRQAARQEAVKASECEKLATGSIRQGALDRQPASAEGDSKMVEQKEGRQASRQAAAKNSNQHDAPRKIPSRLRKGTFYLWLASIWPTTKGQKWLARKGVRKRLQALEEPQLSARQRTETHNNPQGNARVY